VARDCIEPLLDSDERRSHSAWHYFAVLAVGDAAEGAAVVKQCSELLDARRALFGRELQGSARRALDVRSRVVGQIVEYVA